MARKRFNPAALASSDHYAASKKAHRAYLQRNHSSFSFTSFEGKEESSNEEKEDLSIKRQIALDRMPVKVKLFGKVKTITRKEFEELYVPAGFKALE